MKSSNTYQKRFAKALNAIELMLEDDDANYSISIEKLSKLAHFSKYHFHRQFSAFLGISIFKYIQLMRLKKAAYQLSFRKHIGITDIAFDAGFNSLEAFSRAFKKNFNQTPSELRISPDWTHWDQVYQGINQQRSNNMKEQKFDVEIIDFNETKIAVLEHRGSPLSLKKSIMAFIAWRKENKLHPSKSATFNIVYGDPEETTPEDFRFDLCAAIEKDVEENDFGIVTSAIPKGRCAKIRHIGSDDNMRNAFDYLYGNWLTQNDEELRDFPCFMQRISFFPEVAEHKMITDIFLPIK